MIYEKINKISLRENLLQNTDPATTLTNTFAD